MCETLAQHNQWMPFNIVIIVWKWLVLGTMTGAFILVWDHLEKLSFVEMWLQLFTRAFPMPDSTSHKQWSVSFPEYCLKKKWGFQIQITLGMFWSPFSNSHASLSFSYHIRLQWSHNGRKVGWPPRRKDPVDCFYQPPCACQSELPDQSPWNCVTMPGKAAHSHLAHWDLRS